MTTAAALIQAAMREGNLIPVGGTPTAPEQAEALTLLNTFVDSIFGFEMGENLLDWVVPYPQRTAPVAANWPQLPLAGDLNRPASAVTPYPPKNRRLVWGGVTMTVFFPETPMDGSRMAFVQGSGAGDSGESGAVLTLDGNGRLIMSAVGTPSEQVTIADPGAPIAWFYRGDLAVWQIVKDMAIGDQCPFPEEFDDFFICALAKRLAPRYNKVTSKDTIDTALVTLARLKSRYRQAGVTIYGAENIPRTDQSYLGGRWWW